MTTYRLFVLDADEDFHLIDECVVDHIDDAGDHFFPVDSDHDHSEFDNRYEIDCPDDHSLMIVDYHYEHSEARANEVLTYIVTDLAEPITRSEMF